jgi:hypothetical protein
MSYPRLFIRNPLLRIYGGLLQLYPPRFRAEFSAEIRDIFLKVILEAEERGGFWLIKISLRELTALVISIFRECGHELRSRKDKAMVPENNNPDTAGLPGGGSKYLQTAGAPNWIWVARWTLLTTAAFPVALILMAPLAALFLWFINLGGGARLWPGINGDSLTAVGFVTALALLMAAIQWYLLRSFLPRAGWWFAATGGVLLLGCLVAAVVHERISPISGNPNWSWVAFILTFGLSLGLVQWLYLRRFLPNALGIILIDEFAAGSILLAGQSFTSLAELVAFLALPGIITGVGMWLLLRQSEPSAVRQEPMEGKKGKSRRFPRLAWVGLGLAASVPLFFLCIWIYATSQLALAKSNGIYATVEEAVIANNSQGWGGAEVVRVENVHASPNRGNGSQSHVWFGGATVYLDRVPEGWNRTKYTTGSFYIHVREGWVFVGEGAFPEFIGWVMELYGLEGVHR